VKKFLLFALGLAIAAPSCSDDDEGSASGVTFYGHVQPIVNAQCRGCHEDGAAAPFALNDYESVAQYGEAALAAIEEGSMPPWMPDPSCHSYQGERLMSAEEKDVFRKWVEGGKQPGNPSASEPYQAPDLSLSPTHTANVPDFLADAETADDYRCFVLDELTFEEDMYLVASQAVPSSPQVHHILTYALNPSLRADVEALDAASDGPGYSCFGGPVPTDDKGYSNGFPTQIAAWVPGAAPHRQPDQTAIRIRAGSIVVMQVHYSHVGGAPEVDDTELQLELVTSIPEQLASTRPLAVLELDIPAGEANLEFEKRYTNYADEPLTIRSLAGHMHQLGTSIEARVVDESGEAGQCALDIPGWNFNWQQAYDTNEGDAIVVAPGASVDVTCRYDNSAANQPVVDGEKRQPVDVAWGEGSLDEMCLVYLGTVIPYEPAPPADASVCHGFEACDCGPEPTVDCMLGCEDISASCSLCALQATAECVPSDCGAEFLLAETCLTDCFTNSLLFAGSAGRCMDARCPDEYEGLQACLDPILATGSCDAVLAECGAQL